MRTARTLALLALVLAPLGARPQVSAPDDTAEARARFRRATALYHAGRYRDAVAEFEAAYRLKPHGTIHYNVAQCRERLGEWPAALRAYADYLREVPDAKDRAAVRAAMARLEERLAATGVQALLVYTDPPGAEVRLDGKPRGRTPFHLALPPGPYTLRLAREGFAAVERELTLPAETSLTVEVTLEPAAAPAAATPAPSATASASAPPAPAPRPEGAAASSAAPATARPQLAPPPREATAAGVRGATPDAPKPVVRRPHRLWTWVAAGTAVAAAGAGAYYGMQARDAESKLHDGVRLDAGALASDARAHARTANVLYGVAGAAAAAGVTLFFVEGRF